MGVINIGAAGRITVDGKVYEVGHKEAMYISRGAKDVVFESENPKEPAMFYLNSTPAHKETKTVLIKLSGTPSDDVVIVKPENKVECGSLEQSNHRVINKFIVTGQVDTRQLSMGMTALQPGSVWNTMPCHTHERRMEVYMYFDLPSDAFVMHYMGEPQETRHIVVKKWAGCYQPELVDTFGCGSQAYTFIWGMCGENQTYDDMDNIAKQRFTVNTIN